MLFRSGSMDLSNDFDVSIQGANFQGWTASRSKIGDYYTITIKGIPASELGKVFDITVRHEGKSQTWSWSAMSFAYYSQTHQSENLRNVVKALANYYESAYEYMN